MKRLALDFAADGARSRWPARVLLAAGVFLALDTALSYRELRESVESSQAALAQAAPRGAPARTAAPEELAAVRDTVERLAMPWEGLFAALESAADDQVALLAIEPDAKKGTVLISGDSKDYLAALGYVLNLSRAEALRGVQLVRHEKTDESRGSVRFAVSALWNGAQP